MNLTKAHRKENLAVWKSMPPSVIKSPLKYIAARDCTKTVKNGVAHIEMGPIYKDAYRAAANGLGRYVQLQAQSLA